MPIQSTTNYNITDLDKCDYAVLRKSGGIAISNAKQVLTIIFPTLKGNWEALEIDRQDCRSVSIRVLEPDELQVLARQGGMGGVGQAIGTGLRNSAEKRKALANSGLVFRLKSIQTPEVFIHISEDAVRKEIFEAVTQFLEDGAVNGEKIDILLPNSVNNLGQKSPATPNKLATKWYKLSQSTRISFAVAVISGGAFLFFATVTFMGYRDRAARRGLSVFEAATENGYSTPIIEVLTIGAMLLVSVLAFRYVFRSLKR